MNEEPLDSSDNEKKAFAKFLEKQSQTYKGLKKKISDYILSKKNKDDSKSIEGDIEEIIDESLDENFEKSVNNDNFDSHFDRYELPKDDKKVKTLDSLPEEEFHFDRYEMPKNKD